MRPAWDNELEVGIDWDVRMHINGQNINMTAKGVGLAAEGRLNVSAHFDKVVKGLETPIIVLWTSSDSMIFGETEGGARNLGEITGGNYTVMRTIRMGEAGYLNCAWTKIYDNATNTIRTTGIVTGQTNLPEIKGASAMVEDLQQTAKGAIAGQFGTTLVTSGDSIEPQVDAIYTYDRSWEGMPFPQVRIAEVVLSPKDAQNLDLAYHVAFRPAA